MSNYIVGDDNLNIEIPSVDKLAALHKALKAREFKDKFYWEESDIADIIYRSVQNLERYTCFGITNRRLSYPLIKKLVQKGYTVARYRRGHAVLWIQQK